MIQKPFKGPMPSDYQLYLFNEGTNYKAYQLLGSIYIAKAKDQPEGYRFAVWAPNAKSVSLVGDFNDWQVGKHPMQKVGKSGIWVTFVPGMESGQLYKYAITTKEGKVQLKADPFAFYAELRPATASITYRLDQYSWQHSTKSGDQSDLPYQAPVLIYELHAGSWKRHEDGSFLTYRQLADDLIPYLVDLGYTHVELMPLQEHPYDGSWGYQVTGYFAATSRYGKPEDLMYFVDSCHGAGLKVIMDWVPAHFPKDGHGLASFDGTKLYEYEDPRIGEHLAWGTLVFDYGRPEVQSFLISNAIFWLDIYRFDGLRVDAVSSMLYRDYDRGPGQWIANKYGGRENLEAIDFLRKLNKAVFAQFPNALMIAEESTDYPMVTMPIHEGGLGFNYKWNMGWMHDSLKYFSMDHLFRKDNHHLLTFLMMYAYSENYILALSHDEVVHGKKSLLDKMFGSYLEKFSSLRAFYAFMMALPGKKLLFMGGEFGQFIEWRYDSGLDWLLLAYDSHKRLLNYVRDLNHIYRSNKSLWQLDHEQEGFSWIQADDSKNSVFAFTRIGKEEGDQIIVVSNFTPVKRPAYPLRVPAAGDYYELLNSDTKDYGGQTEKSQLLKSVRENSHEDGPYLIYIDLAPLSTIYLKKKEDSQGKKQEKKQVIKQKTSKEEQRDLVKIINMGGSLWQEQIVWP